MQTAADFYPGGRDASDVTDRRVATAWPKDEARLADVLTMAFAEDPAARWLYPDDERYRHDFADFVRVFGGNAVELGTAYQVGGDVACALWLPPGEESDEASVVDHVLRRIAAERHDEVFAVFDAMGHAHPTEPHWYLPLIGVKPAFQGHGFGSPLLRHVLTVCDGV